MHYGRLVDPLSPDDPRHGTTNGFGNLGCRCDACRDAHHQNHQTYVIRLRESGQLTGADFTHGTACRCQMGCRCEACREGRNKKSREDKRRTRRERRWPD